MRDIAVVIPTVDREPAAPNTLPKMLENLARSGAWQSPRLHSVHIVDSGVGTDWPDRALRGLAYTHHPSIGPEPGIIQVHGSTRRRLSTPNVAETLGAGAECGADWVLFCEDDVDFIADFVGAVGRWLDDHAAPPVTVYRFTALNAAMESKECRARGAWDYPVAQSWGTQCMAMRSHLAADLSSWLLAHPLYRHKDGRMADGAYDLEMHRWAAERGLTHFVASVPSFCQHIAPYGKDSAIWKERPWPVEFPTWPGREWTYHGRQKQQEVGA